MMSLSHAATMVNGSLIGADVLFTDVSKDTRSINKGALYVALKGDNFDGHAFIDDANEAGAVAALVSDEQDSDFPQIKVRDTRLALGDLASGCGNNFKAV